MELLNNDSKIAVIHKYGAPRHYTPVQYLSDSFGFDLEFYEYQLITKNLGEVPRKFRNLKFLSGLPFRTEHPYVILGAEPFDPRIALFKQVIDPNKSVYHTSWPFWNSGRVPTFANFSCQTTVWDDFLDQASIVTVTRSAKDALEARGHSAKHIPHAVDTNVFAPYESKFERDVPVVLFVGRLVEEKGIRNILSIARNQEGESPIFRFVGTGPLSDEVEKAAKRDNVEYFGYISDNSTLAMIYSGSDLLVLPSFKKGVWEELFGIVLIEAMASGIPTIGSDCVGPNEIIDHGKTGFIIPQDNINALSSKIQFLINRPQLLDRMGEQSREVAVERYSLEQISTEWEQVLGAL